MYPPLLVSYNQWNILISTIFLTLCTSLFLKWSQNFGRYIIHILKLPTSKHDLVHSKSRNSTNNQICNNAIFSMEHAVERIRKITNCNIRDRSFLHMPSVLYFGLPSGIHQYCTLVSPTGTLQYCTITSPTGTLQYCTLASPTGTPLYCTMASPTRTLQYCTMVSPKGPLSTVPWPLTQGPFSTVS